MKNGNEWILFDLSKNSWSLNHQKCMTESRENWYLDLRSERMNQDCHVLCRRHDFTALKKKKKIYSLIFWVLLLQLQKLPSFWFKEEIWWGTEIFVREMHFQLFSSENLECAAPKIMCIDSFSFEFYSSQPETWDVTLTIVMVTFMAPAAENV